MVRIVAVAVFSVVATLVVLPSQAHAQAGSLAGNVTDSTGAVLPGAQVGVVGTRFASTSGTDGRYRLVGVPAGTYEVRVQRIGSAVRAFPGVVTNAGEETRLDIVLGTSALQIGGYVVSAARRAEKLRMLPPR